MLALSRIDIDQTLAKGVSSTLSTKSFFRANSYVYRAGRWKSSNTIAFKYSLHQARYDCDIGATSITISLPRLVVAGCRCMPYFFLVRFDRISWIPLCSTQFLVLSTRLHLSSKSRNRVDRCVYFSANTLRMCFATKSLARIGCTLLLAAEISIGSSHLVKVLAAIASSKVSFCCGWFCWSFLLYMHAEHQQISTSKKAASAVDHCTTHVNASAIFRAVQSLKRSSGINGLSTTKIRLRTLWKQSKIYEDSNVPSKQ